ncbi:MAG: TldD/PmbA family protein [Candidatus Njordarchaeia archaeon]
MKFSLDEDFARYAVELALSKGVDYAEARIQNDTERVYILKNGKPDAMGISKELGISIRVLVKGSMGFAATDDWQNKEKIRMIVEDAVRMAKANRLGDEKLSEESSFNVSLFVKPKIDPWNVSMEEKIKFLTEIDKFLIEADPTAKVPNRMHYLLEKSTEKVFYNSEGTVIISSIPRIAYFSFFVVVVNGKFDTRFIQKGESRGWEALKDWNLSTYLAGEAKALSKLLREAVEPPEGELDVIIGPSVSGLAAHESVGHPYEADRIWGREGAQAGESFVNPDMLKTKIGSDVVTVIDDPTIPNSYGFYLYDDEGVKAKPRFLIKEGYINEFLHNRETAVRFGTKSNAAARASAYNREPIVRMANTYVAPGDYTFDELLEDIRFGVYIKTFGEWNIDDRRFNMRFVGKEAWLIENGRLTKLVRNPILEITTPAYYASIDAIDKNLEFEAATCGKGDPGQGVPVWTGGPNIRLRNIRVLKG